MYTVGMTKLLKDSGLELSQLAVEELDRLAAYQGESKKSIAKAIGMGRPTVSAKLNKALADREVRDEHGA